jgi:uncharacterized protein YceK
MSVSSVLKGCILALVVLASGCASVITTQVSSFQQWPADAAGSRFSLLAPADGSLEQSSYAAQVAAALEQQGLRQAAPGQPARFLVEVHVSRESENRLSLRPVYQDRYVFHPARRDAAGRIYPGFWGPDPFGPRYVGDQQIVQTISLSRLRLRLLDAQADPKTPRTVYEAQAIHEGEAPLPSVVPWLVRAVFDDFPASNGSVRVVRFKPETGEVLRR